MNVEKVTSSLKILKKIYNFSEFFFSKNLIMKNINKKKNISLKIIIKNPSRTISIERLSNQQNDQKSNSSQFKLEQN